MTRFTAISTFNADGMKLYGRRMVESFCRCWPIEVSLRLYNEGWDADALLAYSQPLSASLSRLADETCEIVHLASASPWLDAFKARNRNRTFRDFRCDAVRFSHKAAAVCHAARAVDADVLIWLDGDIVTHAPVTIADLEALAPVGDQWISWLDRASMYPECGFYMLNLRHENHLGFLSAFEAMYADDALYGLTEYHDSYVLQQVVERERATAKSLSGAGRSTTHPLVNGPLGQWFDHLKGTRKREGRSRSSDLKARRQEGYWQMKEIRGIWFPDSDTHFAAQLAHNPLVDGRGTYQLRKFQAALPHVKFRGHAVDVGAHVGLWSRVMAFAFEKVTAFEPLAEHIACFERNIQIPHVELHRVALAEKAGDLQLAADGVNSGNAAVADSGETVRARTLDSFRLKDIDLIKIDVEGFEVPVIAGGEKTLKRERPAVIVEQKPNGSAERYGRGTTDAVELLRSWGAEVVWEIGGDFLLVWK